MNKFAILGIVLVVIIAGGVGFSFFADSFKCEPGMGEDVNLTIVSKRLEWTFEPQRVELGQCDRVTLKVINEDNFDHGL